MTIAADSNDFTLKISNYVVNGRKLTRIDAIFEMRMKFCIDIVPHDFIRRFLIAEKELDADDVVSQAVFYKISTPKFAPRPR